MTDTLPERQAPRSPQTLWLLIVVSLMNMVLLLWNIYVLSQATVTPVAVPVPPVVHQHITQYQWVRKVSDPLDAWRISGMYFELGMLEDAQRVLREIPSAMSPFLDSSWLWLQVIPGQIALLQKLIDAHPPQGKPAWWEYLGVHVLRVDHSSVTKRRSASAGLVPDGYDYASLRESYAITSRVLGESLCGY